MGIQRTTSRRTFLGGLTGFSTLLAGCGGVRGINQSPVTILAAGSLLHALEDTFRSTVSIPLDIEAHGSATIARLIANGSRDPDIIALADTNLFETLLPVPWYAEFLTNALVIAYNPETTRGRQLRDADQWFTPLFDDGFNLGRTDPDLDPLGYRTIFLFHLAATYYNWSVSPDSLLHRNQLYPETELLARFETGAIDAAIVYRNMAVERNYPHIELPPEINLSSPTHADTYSRVSYRLSDGALIHGDVIRYGTTLNHHRSSTETIFTSLVTGNALRNHGFIIPDHYPTYHGQVPDTIHGEPA